MIGDIEVVLAFSVILAVAVAVEALSVEIAGWKGAVVCTAIYIAFAVQITLAHTG